MDQRLGHRPAVMAERARIVWLWLGGASARAISHQTGASLSTVYRWVLRWQEEGTVETKPYYRRLRKDPWSETKKLLRTTTSKEKGRNKDKCKSQTTLGKEPNISRIPSEATTKAELPGITPSSSCSAMMPLTSEWDVHTDTPRFNTLGHSHPILLYDTLPQYCKGLMHYYNGHSIMWGPHWPGIVWNSHQCHVSRIV